MNSDLYPYTDEDLELLYGALGLTQETLEELNEDVEKKYFKDCCVQSPKNIVD
jgi:hypothetical protein